MTDKSAIDKPSIKQLTIFGVGLIGGSFALALKKAGICDRIVGCNRSEDSLKKAVELGVIDSYVLNPVDAIAGSDVIFLGVPLGAMKTILDQIRDDITPDMIITDGGSAKNSVVEAFKEALGEIPAQFVPGHPIAGRERSGVEAAIDDLYQQRKVILTPLEHTDPDAITTVEALWQACGANVEQMGLQEHDKVLAATSHLPHMLAFQLVDTLNRCTFNEDVFRYAAGGFQDFTRIASSDPVMWRDIGMANREAIVYMIEQYQRDLEQLKAHVSSADGDALYLLFQSAKQARDNFLKQRVLTEEE